jgi:hypothetical protein
MLVKLFTVFLSLSVSASETIASRQTYVRIKLSQPNTEAIYGFPTWRFGYTLLVLRP